MTRIERGPAPRPGSRMTVRIPIVDRRSSQAPDAPLAPDAGFEPARPDPAVGWAVFKQFAAALKEARKALTATELGTGSQSLDVEWQAFQFLMDRSARRARDGGG